MKSIIKKLLSLLSLKVTLINQKSKLFQLGLHKGNADISKDLKTIYLKDFGFKISFYDQRFIIDGVKIMYALKNKVNASFEFSANVFTAKIGGLVYEVQTYEELFILNEIFINGTYKFFTPKNYHLIDIGLNVAFTSIYLADQPNCLSVNGFEPFEPTYRQALVNIELNSGMKNKINTHNFGLGKINETVMVAYAESFKGNMGINGVPGFLSDAAGSVVNQDIEIKSAAEVLSPIIGALAGKGDDIVLKVDCEGSEYEIFNSFAKSSLLTQIDIIILEWHVKGPQSICAHLEKNGFTYFCSESENRSVGMIYAFKK